MNTLLEYWHRKWQTKSIRFHSPVVNPQLLTFAPHLGSLKNKVVLVPLCGKSVDMSWFMQQGAKVIGIEVSPIAVNAFFEENTLPYQQKKQADFIIYHNPQISILLGDFFKLSKKDVGSVNVVYDKGALAALPAILRQDYVKRLTSFTSVNTAILLIACEFISPDPNTSPFSLSKEEIQSLYSNDYHIELLTEDHGDNIQKGLKSRGFCNIVERVFLIKKII